jgi:hypothetical protein
MEFAVIQRSITPVFRIYLKIAIFSVALKFPAAMV